MNEQDAGALTAPVVTTAAARPPAPAWLLRLCGWLACLCYVGASLVVIVTLDLALSARQTFFLGVMGLLVMLWISVVVHEVGHACMARWTGMTLLRMAWGRIDILFLRRGFKLRWAPRTSGRLGYVYAAPPVGMRLGARLLWVLAGGALANGVAALLAFVLALAAGVDESALGASLMAFAVLNVCLAVANLLPYERPAISDGLQILQVLRADKHALPDPITRTIACSVAGEDFPPGLVDEVATLGPQGQLLACLLRMKLAQLDGNWDAAIAQGEQQARIESAMPPAFRKNVHGLTSLLRYELAFAWAMRERDAHFEITLPRDRDTEWTSPQLRPRCQALAAALAGDATRMETLLEQARALAENSRERSVATCEARLARHIRAMCAEGSAPQPTRLASA